MWLINTESLELEMFQEAPTGTYAILSHTWGSDAEELNFDEFKAGQGRDKVGFYKVRKCCEQARQDGLRYAWIDTCCIDKRSSTELSEAINSMFAWYERARMCYAYLDDIRYDHPLSVQEDRSNFKDSRWFTRGWTLQELIAPKSVSFYTRDWQFFGFKADLAEELHNITGIHQGILASTNSFLDYSVAQRMSWVSKRQTTRLEDTAYCLIGLFQANMPLLYGEGAQAFVRLQETILENTDDETIFAWTGVDEGGTGLLAASPACFANSADLRRRKGARERSPYSKTNRGISIECQMIPCEMNTYVVPLQCGRPPLYSDVGQSAIFLCRTSEHEQYRRIRFKGKCTDEMSKWEISKAIIRRIFIPSDGRTIELAPCGLPIVRIPDDSFWSWYFSEPTLSVQSFQAVQLAIGAARIFEGSMGRLGFPGQGIDISQRVLQPVTMVQFLSEEMETGVVIMSSRSTDLKRFYLYLNLGFDREFRPICTLYAAPWRIWKSIRLPRDTNYRAYLVSVRKFLWIADDARTYEEHTVLFMKGYASIFSHILTWLLHLSLFLRPPLRYYSKPRVEEHLWNVTGDRFAGFDLHTGNKLPLEYGCMRIWVEFHHLHGLEWVLRFREEPLHYGTLRHRCLCLYCFVAMFRNSEANVVFISWSLVLFGPLFNLFATAGTWALAVVILAIDYRLAVLEGRARNANQ